MERRARLSKFLQTAILIAPAKAGNVNAALRKWGPIASPSRFRRTHTLIRLGMTGHAIDRFAGGPTLACCPSEICLWTYQLLLRRFPTTDGSAAAMRRDVQAFSKPSSPTTRSRGSRTLLMMYRQLSTAFGKLPCNLIFATGRPSVGKVAAQESTVWPERKLGVIIVSYGMSLATTGERPNGINADCLPRPPRSVLSFRPQPNFLGGVGQHDNRRRIPTDRKVNLSAPNLKFHR
jgi:hypothetical protein